MQFSGSISSSGRRDNKGRKETDSSVRRTQGTAKARRETIKEESRRQNQDVSVPDLLREKEPYKTPKGKIEVDNDILTWEQHRKWLVLQGRICEVTRKVIAPVR